MTVLQYKPIAPYVRNRDTAFAVMMDVVIALLPLYFMAFYFFGLRALLLGLAVAALLFNVRFRRVCRRYITNSRQASPSHREE